MRHGYVPVAFVHDSVLMEFDEDAWERQSKKAAERMLAGMRRVIPDIAVGVEVVGPQAFWGQEADGVEHWKTKVEIDV